MNEIAIWFIAVAVHWMFAWRMTRGASLAIRAPWRGFAVATVFAPTMFSLGGMVTIPFPASLILLSYLLSTGPHGKRVLDEARLAGICFVVSWFCAMLIIVADAKLRSPSSPEETGSED